MSNLTKNITFHHLIDEEDPHCLYCKNKCNIIWVESNYDVSHYPAPSPWININKYYCVSCDEVFRVHTIGESAISFDFTCKDIWVRIYYDTENFSFEKRSDALSPNSNCHWVNGLDNVEFDFSNKDKLYNKIKTYLVFS